MSNLPYTFKSDAGMPNSIDEFRSRNLSIKFKDREEFVSMIGVFKRLELGTLYGMESNRPKTFSDMRWKGLNCVMLGPTSSTLSNVESNEPFVSVQYLLDVEKHLNLKRMVLGGSGIEWTNSLTVSLGKNDITMSPILLLL